ncbi:MAG: DNA replication/repair protein RecF [Pyrinomonadaceae bacterium]
MLLESLDASNFRNIAGKMVFSSGLNMLIGDNGQGKTNWLEAICILATTRSFRTPRLLETVKFNHDLAAIDGVVRQSDEITRVLRTVIQGNSKQFLVNGKRETVQLYLGQLHAVVFTSDELGVVRGGPELRRRFLDEAILALHPPYSQTLNEYSRVIKQKNALLQTARKDEYSIEKTTEMLEPWNDQLAALSTKVHRSRVRVVERLNEMLERRLFGAEEVSIRYASSLEGKGDLADYELLIKDRLRTRVQAEMVSGYSLIGTHRDDLEIRSDGRDIRKYGSSGQQRSAFLLLLLANIAVFHATRNEYPLFLIDDIDAELDYSRIGQLLEFLQEKTQIIVSTSKESVVQKFGGTAAVFTISEGTPKPQ